MFELACMGKLLYEGMLLYQGLLYPIITDFLEILERLIYDPNK